MMTILHCTDLHGKTEHLPAIAAALPLVDVVILTGDLTHFGGKKQAQAILKPFRELFPAVYAVHGNCDKPEVETFLAEEGISLHRTFRKSGPFTILGLGGSLPCPGTTPSEYSDSLLGTWLEELFTSAGNPEPYILAVHQPPYGTKTDRAGHFLHVGSKSLRDFLGKHPPVLCLCGHIHEARGTDSIGNMVLVNPGPFRDGHYALIHFHDKTPEVILK